MSVENYKNILSKEKSPTERRMELESKYDHTTLNNGDRLSMRTDLQSMGHANREGAYQDLLMVIRAGDDFFNVVDVFIANSDKNKNVKTTVLTRYVPGDESRAEIVGFIPAGARDLSVGRTDQNGYSDTTSRKHFQISRSPDDGHIEISDTSTNGTEVFCLVEDGSELRHSPVGSEDLHFWSVKTDTLRQAVEKTFL